MIDYCRNVLRWFTREWPLRHLRHSSFASIGPVHPATGHAVFDELIRLNEDVFSAKGEPNGECELTALTIKTNCSPICQKAYRTPLCKRKLIDEAINEMLEDGVIQPSSSPWASPVTLVPKKDGSIRFCVDYRRLNAVTTNDTYPLPLIQDIFDQVGGSNLQTKKFLFYSYLLIIYLMFYGHLSAHSPLTLG